MGSRTIGDFLKRMRSDRAFRGRMLAAGKDGFDAALREEGYAFTAAELRGQLPQVQTGVRVGAGGARLVCMTAGPIKPGARAEICSIHRPRRSYCRCTVKPPG